MQGKDLRENPFSRGGMRVFWNYTMLFVPPGQGLLQNLQSKQGYARASVGIKVMALLHPMMEEKIYLCTFLSKCKTNLGGSGELLVTP